MFLLVQRVLNSSTSSLPLKPLRADNTPPVVPHTRLSRRFPVSDVMCGIRHSTRRALFGLIGRYHAPGVYSQNRRGAVVLRFLQLRVRGQPSLASCFSFSCFPVFLLSLDPSPGSFLCRLCGRRSRATPSGRLWCGTLASSAKTRIPGVWRDWPTVLWERTTSSSSTTPGGRSVPCRTSELVSAETYAE